MSKTVNAGIVTAYGAAVRGGYEGTYEQFCEDLGKLADVLSEFLGFSVSIQTLAEGEQATANYDSGILSLGIPRGNTGNGIQSIILNADYTLTVTYTNGNTWTSTSIRGEVGATPHLTIGTVETLLPTQGATATITGTDENPVLNLGIPKGNPGEVTQAEFDQLSDDVSDLTRQLSDVSGSLATVETTSTASKAYAVGDLLMYQNQLYKVASAIAADGTLTVGTNIVATTVDNELAEIDNELAEVDEEFARVDEEIAHALISPSMALTQQTYIQNGSFYYAGRTVTIRNGAINIQQETTSRYRGIVITGAFRGSQAYSTNFVPELADCVSIDKIKGADICKTFSSGDADSGISISLYWVNVADTITVLKRDVIAFGGKAGLDFAELNPPENATHFAMYLYFNNPGTYTRNIRLQFDIDTTATT